MRYDVTAGMTSLFYQVGNQNYYLFIIIIILITYYLLILGLWFSLFFRILLSLTQKTYFALCFQMLCRFIPQETAW